MDIIKKIYQTKYSIHIITIKTYNLLVNLIKSITEYKIAALVLKTLKEYFKINEYEEMILSSFKYYNCDKRN